MEKEYRQRGVADFKGFNVSSSHVVTLKFKFRYDEMTTSVSLLAGLNSDITVHAKVGMSKAVNLGLFTIGGLTFDKDGNADITLKSMVNHININSIYEVVSSDSEEKIQLKFMAVLELQDNEENTEKGEEDETLPFN